MNIASLRRSTASKTRVCWVHSPLQVLKKCSGSGVSPSCIGQAVISCLLDAVPDAASSMIAGSHPGSPDRRSSCLRQLQCPDASLPGCEASAGSALRPRPAHTPLHFPHLACSARQSRSVPLAAARNFSCSRERLQTCAPHLYFNRSFAAMLVSMSGSTAAKSVKVTCAQVRWGDLPLPQRMLNSSHTRIMNANRRSVISAVESLALWMLALKFPCLSAELSQVQPDQPHASAYLHDF